VSWSKPLLVIVCLTAFSFALEPLGFLLSSIPLMLLLLRVIDPVRWTLAIPVAALVPLGMWWVLKRLLLIQLPSGLFEIG
jgi:putative tricarboxylic transport membrane protein